METREDGTRVYVDRWPWLNLEDRFTAPGTHRAALLGAVLPDASMGSAKVSSPVYEKAGKIRWCCCFRSPAGFQAGPGCKALHMIYSSMGYGFMMLGAGLILMTAYVFYETLCR